MKVTINQVIRRAFKSKSFLNQLVKDPDRALEKARWELSRPDRRILKRKLRQVYRISGGQLLRLLRYFSTNLKTPVIDVPPPPWRKIYTFPKEIKKPYPEPRLK